MPSLKFTKFSAGSVQFSLSLSPGEETPDMTTELSNVLPVVRVDPSPPGQLRQQTDCMSF